MRLATPPKRKNSISVDTFTTYSSASWKVIVDGQRKYFIIEQMKKGSTIVRDRMSGKKEDVVELIHILAEAIKKSGSSPK